VTKTLQVTVQSQAVLVTVLIKLIIHSLTADFLQCTSVNNTDISHISKCQNQWQG